jgi:hypothetical protein
MVYMGIVFSDLFLLSKVILSTFTCAQYRYKLTAIEDQTINYEDWVFN